MGGGGALFFLPIDFAEPPPPTPLPAINNERSLTVLSRTLYIVFFETGLSLAMFIFFSFICDQFLYVISQLVLV